MTPLAALLLSACGGDPATPPTPPPTGTDTGSPNLLPLDSAPPLGDSAPDGPPDLSPSHWVTLEQSGSWDLEPASPPWESMSGTLRVREHVDELDTGAPQYSCEVTYALTGPLQEPNTCGSCEAVFRVEHYVQEGDPAACRDPDLPRDGAVWNLGFDPSAGYLLHNYGGTGLWLPWYPATRVGNRITFEWTAVLAVELEETGSP